MKKELFIGVEYDVGTESPTAASEFRRSHGTPAGEEFAQLGRNRSAESSTNSSKSGSVTAGILT